MRQIDFQLLKDILYNDNSDHIFEIVHVNVLGDKEYFEDIKCLSYFRLIPYLIRNEYIDES